MDHCSKFVAMTASCKAAAESKLGASETHGGHRGSWAPSMRRLRPKRCRIEAWDVSGDGSDRRSRRGGVGWGDEGQRQTIGVSICCMLCLPSMRKSFFSKELDPSEMLLLEAAGPTPRTSYHFNVIGCGGAWAWCRRSIIISPIAKQLQKSGSKKARIVPSYYRKKLDLLPMHRAKGR